MSEKEKIHELAGGWITERAGTPIPAFLKLTYVGFCLFGLWYLWAYWAGETTHADGRVRHFSDRRGVGG